MSKQSSLLLKVYIFIVVLLMITLTSCGGNEQETIAEDDVVEMPKTEDDLAWEKAKEEEEAEVDTTPLDQKLDELSASVLDYQKTAFDLERSKINDSQSLLTEIEQSMTGYNTSLLNEIRVSLKEVEAGLYNEETLADETVMEEYDLRTEKMIDLWKQFKEETAGFDKQVRAKQIYEDIMLANEQDAKMRRHYNIDVHDFNVLLSERADEVKKLGEKYARMEPFVFFYGSDPFVQ